MTPRPDIPAEFEEHRDERWRRDSARQIETAFAAERFIEQAGFAACLTDSRRPGPSLYVAVCGRRDAVMPRHVQKDPEASLTWQLKDELVRRGKVYYAKLSRGKAMSLAPRMIPYFHAIWGIRRSDEPRRLSRNAQQILRVLRKEWEMATADLRVDSGVTERAAFNKALDELQAAMIVVPSEVYYQPKFTYVWTLGVGRFPDGLRRRISRETALREIARCFLDGAGMTVPGELARVTGLSRVDAGRGNRALVAEGYATMPARGTYRLAASGTPDVHAAETHTRPAAWLRELRGLLNAAFAGQFGDEDWQHALGGTHVWRTGPNGVVSHASVVEREIVCGEKTLRVGYVEAVATAPGHQRQGHARAVMERIGDLIRERYELGVLSTGAHAFYETLGWERWPGETFVTGPHGRERTPDDDDSIMILRTSRSPDLDLGEAIVCDRRAGDSW